jgi:hypothetical protein
MRVQFVHGKVYRSYKKDAVSIVCLPGEVHDIDDHTAAHWLADGFVVVAPTDAPKKGAK